MAHGKKSFILYCDLKHTVELLDDALAGKLLKHLLRYVNDENPETDDMMLKIIFEPIKHQLKRDLKDWEETREKRVKAGHEGGIKSGESRRKNRTEANEANASKLKQTEANEAVTVTVNDTVTVNVKEGVNTPALENSNLFRKPKVPTKNQVWEVFMNHGGTKEMAKKFFEANQATEWYLKGSPITNFSTLVPGYIQRWNELRNKENGQQSGSAPLRIAE